MKTYIMSIMSASVVAGILESILPGERLKRHLHYLFSCVMLLLLVTPLLTLLPGLGKIEDEIKSFVSELEKAEKNGTEQGEALIESYQEEAISAYVKERLQSEFALDPAEVTVAMEKVQNNAVLHITLHGRASWTDSSKVIEYFKKELNCQVKVTRK